MTASDRLRAIERSYLVARDARDRLDVARACGEPADVTDLEARALAASVEVHGLLAAFRAEDAARLRDDDRRALELMRAGIDAADGYDLPVTVAKADAGRDEAAAQRDALARGGDALRTYLEARFAVRAAAVTMGGESLSRLQVLARLGAEPDPAARRTLFGCLEPLWRVMAGGDGGSASYRALLRDAAAAWRTGDGATARNAAALGVTREEVEAWCQAALAAWRAAVVEPALAAGEPPVEPWDWWWRAGSMERTVGPVPLDEVEEINRAMYASLGADLGALGVRFDVRPRPGRPLVPVAFTTFGARPHRRRDGTWTTGEPVVMATYTDGGMAELAELLHETGHAIHIAGIRTRPAFADWPVSDALTEALADIVAWDLAELAWQRRWLGGRPAAPAWVSARCHHAGTVLDAAWAVFEIRLLGDPSLDPDQLWTEITSTWLGIAPHPELSWWAMRGQLVQEPGYMTNYAVGAVLTAALRAAIRDARGDWTEGDPGWYAWVRDRVYRFGLERSPGEVVRGVGGRLPGADALAAEIARAAAPG